MKKKDTKKKKSVNESTLSLSSSRSVRKEKAGNKYKSRYNRDDLSIPCFVELDYERLSRE